MSSKPGRENHNWRGAPETIVIRTCCGLLISKKDEDVWARPDLRSGAKISHVVATIRAMWPYVGDYFQRELTDNQIYQRAVSAWAPSKPGERPHTNRSASPYLELCYQLLDLFFNEERVLTKDEFEQSVKKRTLVLHEIADPSTRKRTRLRVVGGIDYDEPSKPRSSWHVDDVWDAFTSTDGVYYSEREHRVRGWYPNRIWFERPRKPRLLMLELRLSNQGPDYACNLIAYLDAWKAYTLGDVEDAWVLLGEWGEDGKLWYDLMHIVDLHKQYDPRNVQGGTQNGYGPFFWVTEPQRLPDDVLGG